MTISAKCGKLLKQNAPVCGSNSATTAQKIRACVRKQFRHDGAKVTRLCAEAIPPRRRNKLRLWRNWQFFFRARPAGDEARFEKAQKQREMRPKEAFRLCFKLSRANYYFVFLLFAPVAELADAQDLGSCVNSCRFDPCQAHHQRAIKKILPRKALIFQGFSYFYSPFFGGAIL